MPIEFPAPDSGAPPPQPGGLGERLVNGLRFTAEAILRALFEPVAATLARGVERATEEAQEDIVQMLAQTKAELEGSPQLPVMLGQLLTRVQGAGGVTGALARIIGIGGIISTILSFVVSVLKRNELALLGYEINRATPVFRISAEDGIMAERRGILNIQNIVDDLRDLGVDQVRAMALIQRSYRWLTVSQIEELLFRRIIDHTQARTWLKGVGFPDDQIDPLLLSFDRLVPLSDLTRFAIREVFTERFASSLIEDMPGESFFREAEKLGLSRQRATWYWMAHWRLPAPTQFQTFYQRLGPHRGKELTFSLQDFDDGLRRDDWLKQYRPFFKATAHRPLNRLDIWRLGSSGKLTPAEMEQHYMDYGYSPELAARMAEIAGEEKTAESRLLTQSLIQDAYKRRVLTHDEAYQSLIGLRFRPEDAQLVLTLSDLQKQSERAGERTSIIRQRFVAGLIADAQAVDQLATLGKPASEIEDLLDLWRAQLADRVQVPPVGTLEGWYKRRIISGPTAIEELRRRGYQERYINNYLLEWDQEIQETEERLSAAELLRRQAELKVPTRADLAAWTKAGIITLDAFAEALAAQGYSATDVANYARLVGLEITPPAYTTPEGKVRVATLRELYRRDIITIDELQTGLADLGMSPGMAEAIATYELAKTL